MNRTTTLIGRRGHLRVRCVDLGFSRHTEWSPTELAFECELINESERVTLSPAAVTDVQWTQFRSALASVTDQPATVVDEDGNSSSDMRDCDDSDLEWDGWTINGTFAVRRVDTAAEGSSAQISVRQLHSCANPGHWVRAEVRTDETTCRFQAMSLGSLARRQAAARAAKALGFDVHVPADHQALGYGRHVDSEVAPGAGAIHLMLGRPIGMPDRQACWSIATLLPSITGIHASRDYLVLGARTSSEQAVGCDARLAEVLRCFDVEPVAYLGLTDATASALLAQTTGSVALQDPVAVTEMLRLRHAGLDLRRCQAVAQGCVYPDLAHVHSDNLAEDLTFEWDEQRTGAWADGAGTAQVPLIGV